MNDSETQAMLDAMESDQKKSKKFWSPEEGENTIRFMPPLAKAKQEILPYFHHKVHWVDGTPYECLNQSMKDKDGNLHSAGDCPMCKKAMQIYKVSEKGTPDWDLAGQLRARDRYIYRVVVRGSKEETKPQFYESGPSVFKKFFAILKSGKYGNIVHPTEGRDFILSVEGTGRRASYDNSLPDADRSPLFQDADKMKEVLKNAIEMDYSSLVTFSTYEIMATALKEFLEGGTDNSSSSGNVTENKKQEQSFTSSSKKEVSKSESDSAIDDVLAEFDADEF